MVPNDKHWTNAYHELTVMVTSCPCHKIPYIYKFIFACQLKEKRMSRGAATADN